MPGSPTEVRRIKSFCNNCSGRTWHVVVAAFDQSWAIEHLSGWDEYFVLRCAGCDEVSFRHDAHSSEDDAEWDTELEDWVRVPRTTVYPPRVARPVPKWLGELDEPVREVLIETYAALHSDSIRLATMGTRTALERVMVSRVGDRSNFAALVDEFIKQGFMAEKLKDPIMNVLDAGNAAAHRGYAPSEEGLRNVFDIVESVIHTTCIAPVRAEAVRETTPKRPPHG